MKRGRFRNSCFLCVTILVLLIGSPSRQGRASATPKNALDLGTSTSEIGAPDGRRIDETASRLLVQQAAGARKKTSPFPGSETKTPAATHPSAGPSADQASHTPKLAISEFAWLEGKWQGAWGPRVAEQVWTAPKAGQMLGLFRVLENDKALVIELFSLFQTADGVELRLRHFTSELVPWEQSDLTTLKLVGLDAQTAIFENPSDGQPKRDVFTRIDPDTYTFKSDVVPAAGGTHATEIRYHRQK